MHQPDLFAPPAPPVQPNIRKPCEPRPFRTRAAQNDGIVNIYDEGYPDPFEIVVRGRPCVISWSGGVFCTHVIEPAGARFWSEAGFRSFGIALTDPDDIRDVIEAYIDKPAKAYGCGGKLERWWPDYVRWWRQSLDFELTMTRQLGGRDHIWDQWGRDEWVRIWRQHDERQAGFLIRMIDEGIDPNEVGAPSHFKGKWPRFDTVRQVAA